MSLAGVLLSAFQLVIPAAIVAGAIVAVFAEPIAIRHFDDPRLTSVLPIFGIAILFAAIAKLSVGGTQGLQLSMPKVSAENLTAHGARLVLAVTALLRVSNHRRRVDVSVRTRGCRHSRHLLS